MTRAARANRGGWSGVLTVASSVMALTLLGLFLANEDLRGLIAAVFGGLAAMIRSLPPLLMVDGGGTARSAAIVMLTFVAMVAGPFRFFLHGSIRRVLWMPLWLCLLALPASVAPLGISLPQKYLAMLAFGILGWICATRRRVWWLTFAPMVVAIHPTSTIHGGPLSERLWSKAALAQRCAANDGVRPSNFTIDKATPHHYAVTPIDDGIIVLTGERGAWRLRREADGRFAFIGDFAFAANLWQGSLGEGLVFFTHRGSGLVAVTATDLATSPGRAKTRQIPALPDASPELDLLDAVYEPTTRAVFLTELVRGGLWEVSLPDDTMRYHDLRAFYLQAVRRHRDAMLVAISTTELLVFDPRTRQVTERTAAALGAGGLDVCQGDGAVAVADYAGRLRLFTIGPDGKYRFERGVALSSPRRVAFAPDCAWIAISSGDDETAYVLRRADLSIWRTFRLGPGLRDIVYTGPREVAVVDACTVNVLPGGEP